MALTGCLTSYEAEARAFAPDELMVHLVQIRDEASRVWLAILTLVRTFSDFMADHPEAGSRLVRWHFENHHLLFAPLGPTRADIEPVRVLRDFLGVRILIPPSSLLRSISRSGTNIYYYLGPVQQNMWTNTQGCASLYSGELINPLHASQGTSLRSGRPVRHGAFIRVHEIKANIAMGMGPHLLKRN
jgi:hypothetical protein